ncbi:hypothetical protein NC651_033015 [Populus alba x Populus x berolinensis]|nr:hypothetical protein NC651_033015 [Populus alba x Populus x berolinensis]
MLNATCYSLSLFFSFSFFQGKEQREREKPRKDWKEEVYCCVKEVISPCDVEALNKVKGVDSSVTHRLRPSSLLLLSTILLLLLHLRNPKQSQREQFQIFLV